MSAPQGHAAAKGAVLRRNAALCSVACCLLDLVAVAVCVARFFVRSGDGNMQVTGWRGFVYFTVDSNVLAALASGTLAVFCLRRLRRAELRLPQWLRVFRLAGTSAVTLTMVTVLAFLGPIYGYGSMFEGANLWLHGLCPLLCIVSFVCFERGAKLPFSSTLLAVLPTAVYGAVYMLCVVVWRCWDDFYRFNLGGMWYVSAPVILLSSWLLSCVLRRLNRKRSDK